MAQISRESPKDAHLHKSETLVCDLRDELDALALRSMVDTPLQHTAPVAMGSDLDAVGSHSVVDELIVFWFKRVEALLDDVVAVEVLDEGDYMAVEGRHEGLNLTGRGEVVDQSLNGAGTVTAKTVYVSW